MIEKNGKESLLAELDKLGFDFNELELDGALGMYKGKPFIMFHNKMLDGLKQAINSYENVRMVFVFNGENGSRIWGVNENGERSYRLIPYKD